MSQNFATCGKINAINITYIVIAQNRNWRRKVVLTIFYTIFSSDNSINYYLHSLCEIYLYDAIKFKYLIFFKSKQIGI